MSTYLNVTGIMFTNEDDGDKLCAYCADLDHVTNADENTSVDILITDKQCYHINLNSGQIFLDEGHTKALAFYNLDEIEDWYKEHTPKLVFHLDTKWSVTNVLLASPLLVFKYMLLDRFLFMEEGTKGPYTSPKLSYADKPLPLEERAETIVTQLNTFYPPVIGEMIHTCFINTLSRLRRSGFPETYDGKPMSSLAEYEEAVLENAYRVFGQGKAKYISVDGRNVLITPTAGIRELLRNGYLFDLVQLKPVDKVLYELGRSHAKIYKQGSIHELYNDIAVCSVLLIDVLIEIGQMQKERFK